jgi:hypothetical protein
LKEASFDLLRRVVGEEIEEMGSAVTVSDYLSQFWNSKETQSEEPEKQGLAHVMDTNP